MKKRDCVVRVCRDTMGQIVSMVSDRNKPTMSGEFESVIIDRAREGRTYRSPDVVVGRAKLLADLLGLPYEEDFAYHCQSAQGPPLSVPIVHEVGDSMTQTTPVTLNARKEHLCDWCNEGIEIGDLYSRWRWFDVRDAYTIKMHSECRAAAIAFPAGSVEFDGNFMRGCWCESGTEECDCEYGERMRAKEAP